MKFLAIICLTVLMLLGSMGESFALPPCPSDQNQRYHNCFGTYTFADGDKYVGEFKDDKYHGQGTHTWADGAKYVGEWKKGLRHGQGIATYPDGTVREGIWENGKFQHAKKGTPTATRSADFQKAVKAWKKKDYATAFREIKPLAEQGWATAQFNLGVMYGRGLGVPKDYKTAVKWWKLAAKKGNAKAQNNLGMMYAFGKGIVKDYVYTYMWANIAASNGNEMGVKLRDLVEKKITPSQIEKAQGIAHECIRKKYKGC